MGATYLITTRTYLSRNEFLLSGLPIEISSERLAVPPSSGDEDGHQQASKR